MIPAVVPDEVEIAFQKRHHYCLFAAFFHGDDGDALSVFICHADGRTFPTIAAFVGEFENDVAFVADKNFSIGSLVETEFIFSDNRILVKSGIKVHVVDYQS